jgi:hypothetical protein
MQARSARRSTLVIGPNVIVRHRPIVDRRGTHGTKAARAARVDAARPSAMLIYSSGRAASYGRTTAGAPFPKFPPPARERERRRVGQLARMAVRPSGVWGARARLAAGAPRWLTTGYEEPRLVAASCRSA